MNVQSPIFQNGHHADWPSLQKEILEYCVNCEDDLTARLKETGHSRDDLQYVDNSKAGIRLPSAPLLEDFARRKHNVPMVSFFSGCGGLDLGFEAAGFHHVALVEHNKLFCETLRLNRPKWNVIGPPLYGGDVSKREELLAVLRSNGVQANFPGVFAGGPPCQPFSIAANQRYRKDGKNFKRIGFEHEKNGNLLFDLLWFIEQLRPAAFLIENVEGLYDVDGGEQLQKALQDLCSWGYTVAEPFVLDASHFQVPQFRRRLFITGTRLNRAFVQPEPNYNLVASGAALQRSMKGVANHEPRDHKPESILRYMILNYGQRDQLGRVDRIDPLLPSKTVIAGGTKGGGRSHLHPHVPRTMTARESARLQTFPDDYVFLGPSARQFTQVGNAVPPILAAQLATSIYRSYFTNRRNER